MHSYLSACDVEVVSSEGPMVSFALITWLIGNQCIAVSCTQVRHSRQRLGKIRVYAHHRISLKALGKRFYVAEESRERRCWIP